jgi:hypothetical protein
VTAVTVASKNKMDLAIGVAVGSSIQIGMLVPLLLSPRTQLTHHSSLCNPLHSPSWMGHGEGNVTLLYPLRNCLPLRFSLHRQLPCP